MGSGLAVGGAEPKHKKISDSQGQQFQIALILNGTSGDISGINIYTQSLPFVGAFAEWNPAGCCFPSVFLLWRGTRAVFSSLLPKPPEEGIKLRSEPARSWARPRQEGDKNESCSANGAGLLDLFSPRLLLVPAFDVLDLSEFLNLLWAPTGRGSDLYLRGVSLALGSSGAPNFCSGTCWGSAAWQGAQHPSRNKDPTLNKHQPRV